MSIKRVCGSWRPWRGQIVRAALRGLSKVSQRPEMGCAIRRIFIGRNVLVKEGSFLLPFVPSKDSYHGRRWRQLLGLKPVGQCNLGSVEPAAKVRTEAATASSKAVRG